MATCKFGNNYHVVSYKRASSPHHPWLGKHYSVKKSYNSEANSTVDNDL